MDQTFYKKIAESAVERQDIQGEQEDQKQKQKQRKKQRNEQRRSLSNYQPVSKVDITKIYQELNPHNTNIRNFQSVVSQYHKKHRWINKEMRDELVRMHKAKFPMWKSSIQKIKNNNNIYQSDVPDYKPGKFSEFAFSIQNKLNQKDRLIQKILQQAVISYEKAIKQQADTLKKLLDTNQSQKHLHQLFQSDSEIKSFLQDPVKFTVKQNFHKNTFSLQQICRKFFERRMALKKTGQIDGKFLAMMKLKLQNRFYAHKHLYIPIQNSNLYVRLQQTGKLTKVIFKNGKFFDEKEILYLGQKAKQEILAMVLLYLKNQNILVERNQIESLNLKIQELIHKIK